MKVWLIETGEVLPLQLGVRKMRTGLLADKLVERGHSVRWWVSAFEHQRKVWIYNNDQEVPLSQGLTLQVLRGCGYSSNISLFRYLDQRLIAGKFRSQARKLAPPDIMVTSMPCHHLAFEAVRFARSRDIPILVDVLDLWPDIFLTAIKNPLLKQVGQLVLVWDFCRLQRLLCQADGILGVSMGYLDWALDKVGRAAHKWDRVFFLGYQAASEAVRASRLPNPPTWLKGHETKKLILFIGTFGFSYELSLVVEAARRLQSSGREDVCFILAGTGEQEGLIRRESAGLANVLIPGWIGAEEIAVILRLGYLGLLSYTNTAPQSLPYKPFEYLSNGLPLVCSLEGEMAELIKSFGLGLIYRAGDLDGLCRAIETLLDNRSLRDQISANALAFFKEYGDAEKIYTEYAKHMERFAEADKMVTNKTLKLKSCRIGRETLNNTIEFSAGLKAGRAPVMWRRTVREALPTMRELIPPGSRVLEVGYGDGLLTCFLCREIDWRVLGLEIDENAQRLAQENANQYGLSDRIEFRCCEAEEIFQHQGQFDAVFIKTVLYNSPNLQEYARWLDWILSVLRPGGTFINFATGRANALTQWYRRLRGRPYTDLCLYTSQVEALYDARFEIIERRYYGGYSQFLTPVPALYHLAARLEDGLRPRHADNSFIISIIAKRLSGEQELHKVPASVQES